MDGLSVISSVLGPLCGSGFGSWAAFKYNTRTKIQEVLIREIELSKYAQFVIIAHIHVIKNVWKRYLGSNIDNENRHLVLVRFDFTENVPIFDFEKLSFMLDKIDPNIPYELFTHERRFLDFIDSIKTRNDFYNQFLNGRSESSESQAFLKELTDNMYDSYARINNSNGETSRNFLIYLQKRYPGYKHFLCTKELQTSPQVSCN